MEPQHFYYGATALVAAIYGWGYRDKVVGALNWIRGKRKELTAPTKWEAVAIMDGHCDTLAKYFGDAHRRDGQTAVESVRKCIGYVAFPGTKVSDNATKTS